MPGTGLSPEDIAVSKKTWFLLCGVYIQVWAFERASGSRNNPQAGPSTSNDERREPRVKVGDCLKSGSTEIGPELKIFMEVAYQEVLSKETHSGAGKEVRQESSFKQSPLKIL